MDEARALQTHEKELNLGHPELMAIEREYCSRGLPQFIERAWKVVEPAQRYVHGWHIDAICDHLMAVANQEINRLAIEVPPGSMKSLTTAVFWPAFEWGPADRAWSRFVATSHSENLAARDNLRTKRLIESDWFQAHWGHRVQIRRDQSSKLNFENTQTGFRQSSPYKSITGKRGNHVLVDDPISVADCEIEAYRSEVNQLFREAMPLRMVDPVHSSITAIMQRLHEDDLIGLIRRHPEWGYVHLMIPMEYDPDRKCYTSIGWEDPRTEPGELMFEERFPRAVVERDKEILGDYASAGQFDQLPVPRSGGDFQIDNIDYINPTDFDDDEEIWWCRGWDLAGTRKKKSAYTAGVRIGYRVKRKRWVIAHAVRDKVKSHKMRELLKTVAGNDPDDCQIVFPKDPGQAGIDQSTSIAADLSGYTVYAEPQSGSKEIRAEPFASQVNSGNVDIVIGPWNKAYMDEMKMFPRGQFKDQIDASASAFNKIARKLKKKPKPKLTLVIDNQENSGPMAIRT